MPQKILCTFAHPDDEAFGPGGTIIKWAQANHTVHLLCATRGEVGNNASGQDTAKLRESELHKSANILGIQTVEFLNYTDGQIGNQDLPDLEVKIQQKVNKFKPNWLLTFNLNGVSGHLDHIAVASATTQVFKKTPFIQKLYYYTETKATSDQMHDYFIHFPPGIDPQEADETIDIEDVYHVRKQAMLCHQSQIEDVNWILKHEAKQPKKEHFLLKSR